MSTTKKTQDVAPAASQLDTDSIAEAADLLGGLTRADFTVWTMRPGVTGWVDGNTGENKPVIHGVFCDANQVRAWWANPLGTGDVPVPDCSSADAKIGAGTYGVHSTANPSGSCTTCPMSAWGSAGGGSRRGQACRTSQLVWLLPEGATLPHLVQIPPTSIPRYRRYVLACLGGNFSPIGTFLTISTETETGTTGLTYPVAVFSEPFPPKNQDQARAMRRILTPSRVLEVAAASIPVIEND